MIHRIRTIDAHAAGEPLRLILDGFPAPEGRTMLEKRAWLKAHADDLRRAIMLEPRGHADMYGALLTEAVSPEADAGVLFMHNEGYSTMCGHGVVAVTTLVFERGLVTPGNAAELVLDSPAGLIRARPAFAASGRVESVSFVNVPSFVLHGGVPVRLGTRQLLVDVAFGGAFYAIVDSEAVGIPIDATRIQDLRRVGMDIKRAVEAGRHIVHPEDAGLKGIYGTIFTGQANNRSADLRNVTIFADAEVDRSPCGTGTCAVMAVLDAMNLLPEDRPFVHESLIGTLFRGRSVGRARVGDHEGIVPEIEGSAWTTGEHTFLVDDEDPLKEGFRI
jgi:proline racemase